MLLREQIRADLIVLDFRYFDAGMDWLSAYHARVDCFRKIVTQYPINHRLNLLGCVMNIPLESRPFMPLHFWLHWVHGFHFGELSLLFWALKTYHRPFYMQDWGRALLSIRYGLTGHIRSGLRESRSGFRYA